MKKLLFALTLSTLALSGAAIVAEKASAADADADGFVSLFNGKDLTGWKGLDGLWSVKDGVIDGEEVREHSHQTDLILADSIEHPEKYANFELHIKWQFLTKDGNSGIQYRSKINNEKELHCGGYQADIDSVGGYTGSIYDESGVAGGRGTMSNRGEKTVWTAETKRENSPLPENGDELKKLLHNSDGWNEVVLRVQGNHTVYSINGHVMTDMTDNSPKAVADGVIGLQMHAGFTMHLQFKDVKIKFLDAK